MPNELIQPEVRPRYRRELDPELDLLAQWMDSVFEIPGLGIRFGLDALIGLIPGLGDTLTTLASLYILGAARRYGVPRITLVRMAANIAVDYLLGAVPLVGDVFDVYWKANLRNVALLRRHLLATPSEERRARSGDWLFVAGLMALLVTLAVGAVTLGWLMVAALAHVIVGQTPK